MRFGGIVLTGLLILGACSPEPEPKEPDPSATTATPTLTAPSMPAQAKKDTPEGAAAFVKHYIDVFNYASSTGDVAELSRLSSPKCEGCQSYIKLYRETYAAGGYFKGSDWSLSDFEVEQAGEEISVYVHASAPKGAFRESKDAPELHGEGEDTELLFNISRGQAWRVRSFDRRTS